MVRRARSEQASDSSDASDAVSVSGEHENTIVDPGEIDAASGSGSGETDGSIRYNKDGTIAKKRGRKPGWKKEGGSAKANPSVPLDVNAIQFSLSGIHSLLSVALFPKDDEMQKAMQLSENEGKILAENIVAVGRHYDLIASQKSIDWFNLIMACSTIYGSRIIVISRAKAVRKQPPMPSSPSFVGTRQPVMPQSTSPIVPRPNGEILKVNEEERKKLAEQMLNEPPILRGMQSG